MVGTNRKHGRAAWVWNGLAAFVFAVFALLPSFAFDAACLVGVDCTDSPCDEGSDDDRPCSCPVACPSCGAAARAVPPGATTTVHEPLPINARADVPVHEEARRPGAPDPGEIGHVPRV